MNNDDTLIMMNVEYSYHYDDNDDDEMEVLGKQHHHQVEGSLAYLSTLYQQHEEIEKIELDQDFMASFSTISGGQYIWKLCLNIWKAKNKTKDWAYQHVYGGSE